MSVLVIGKKKCGVCDSAKKKLDLMQIPYDFVDIEVIQEPHDDWRVDGTVDAVSYFHLNNCTIPTLVVDGVPFTYSAAMAHLKGLRK